MDGWRLGIDTGGTYTDLVAVRGTERRIAKVPSTPPDFDQGVLDAIAAAGIAPGDIELLAHGTTVATNAVITGGGAPTAGRDTNAILSEVMDTPERPEAQRAALREVSQLIDGGRYAEAREKIDALERAVTARDREVVGLRTMLHFLEGDDAADSQAP